VVAALVPLSAQAVLRASADTSFTTSIDRGAGTALVITVTNAGPNPTYSAPNPSGPASTGFSLTLDQGSSGSTYLVAGAITASSTWQCGAQYDYITCSTPGSFAPGQSMTMKLATGLCYPAGHAYTITYFTSDGGLVGNQAFPGTFSGPAGDCSLTGIGPLHVSVSDEIKRLAAQYRQRVDVLGERKQALEDTLAQKRSRLDQAETALTQASSALGPIVARIEQTKSFVAQIAIDEASLPESVRAEIRARDQLEATIITLQDRIVQVQQAGNEPLAGSLESKLASAQSDEADLNRSLRSKEGLIGKTRELSLAKLRVLDGQLFAARLAQALALRERALADADLQQALGQRAALDAQLSAVAEQLARLDIVVTSVTVTTGYDTTYRVLYRAELPASLLSIQQLDDDIGNVGRSLADLNTRRQAALADFLAAEGRATAALNTVTATIWSTALKKAAVDFVSNLIDVVKAMRNGGLIGASTETLKKVVETLTKEYLVDYGPGKYSSPGAVEFDRDLQARLSDAYVGKVALKTGVERVVKETVTKTGKDELNKRIGTLVFEKVYGKVPALYEQAAQKLVALGNPSVKQIQEIQQAVDARAKQFESLGGTVEGRVKSPKGVGTKIGDLAVTILKDAAKNALKAHFDVQEQQAWIAYYEQEMVARTYFPLYQAIADAYWQAYDTYNALLDQKAQVIEGYRPVGAPMTEIDKTFLANDDLTVEVDINGSLSPSGSLLDVLIDGTKPAYNQGTSYIFSGASLPPSAGTREIEIRVH
jgi:hypothetical protein